MAQTIENINDRTILQQFHSLYKKQSETETDVENLGTKIDQETIDRQTADLSINSEIQALKDQIDSLGVLFTYKGEVATIQDLPATDNKPGDVYYVESDQSEYIWLEKSGVYQWEQFGPAIDLSAYAKQADLEQLQNDVNSMNTQVENNASNIVSLTNTKQDKLTAGTNITIDENNVISASGSGGQLYEHNIVIINQTSFTGSISIITNSNDKIVSFEELSRLIRNKYGSKNINVNFFYKHTKDGKIFNSWFNTFYISSDFVGSKLVYADGVSIDANDYSNIKFEQSFSLIIPSDCSFNDAVLPL